MGKETEIQVSDRFIKEGEKHALQSSCRDEQAFMVGYKKSAQALLYQVKEKINKQILMVSKPIKNEDVKPLEPSQKSEILWNIQGLKSALGILSQFEQQPDDEEDDE